MKPAIAPFVNGFIFFFVWLPPLSTQCFHPGGLLFLVQVNKGFLVGETGTILRTINGGVTWTADASGTIENFNSVFFIKPK
jgi:photosystem II stability/assembly factor-like uncharacterized protein